MEQPAGLRAIVGRAGLSESQVFRALQALEREGYVEHVGRRGYRIGSRSVALAAMIGPRPAVMRTVYPAVSHLVSTTGHSVAMHLRSGLDRVLVLGVPAPHTPIRDTISPGERSRLNVGCSGRVILAHLSEREANAITPAVAAERLRGIRERGYDISCGEYHPGINGIAGPLLEDDGTPLGSISIVGPADRLPETALERLAGPLLSACQELSPRLANLLGPNPGTTIKALDLVPSPSCI